MDSALAQDIYIDRDAIRAFVNRADYPINFLDFETFNSAVPKFTGQRPYSTQIPFQYSLHILHRDGEIEHKEYLADEHQDPRAEIAARLAADITPSGSIAAYHQVATCPAVNNIAS